MIEDFFLDKLGGNTSSIHLIGLETITEIKNKYNLVDIWRKINPSKTFFTYHNPDKTIHTRLDRNYISKKAKTKTSKIQTTSLSDHDGVYVTFQVSEENPRESGIWKMNTSVLKHKKTKEILQSFWEYWQKKKIEYENHNVWWDTGKMYLKTIIIDFCTRKKKQINKKQQDLIFYITQEKSKLIPNIEKINKYQQELNEIENYKTEGTVIRSKEKVILNEEKPTKYFYTQEKQNKTKKNITTLIDEKWNILQKNTDILNECKNYYQKLYINQNTCLDTQKQLLQQIQLKVSEMQNQRLTKQIQIIEIQQALQTMENGKSPGMDGIPVEFYKEFFDLLKKDLQDIFNNVLFQQKTTPKTWNQAIISLIPKQTEKLNSLKYW